MPLLFQSHFSPLFPAGARKERGNLGNKWASVGSLERHEDGEGGAKGRVAGQGSITRKGRFSVTTEDSDMDDVSSLGPCTLKKGALFYPHFVLALLGDCSAMQPPVPFAFHKIG